MAIRKRLTRRALFTGAATAVAIGASAGVALAVAITFTITPGGAITGKAGTTTLTDTGTGTKLQCTSSTSKGTLKKGSGISGANLGSITAQTFTNCTGPLGLQLTVTTKHFPWTLSGTSFNATTGTTTGFINGIEATVTGPSCSLTVAGTTATTPAKVKVTYTNSTGKLKVLTTGGTLHTWNVNGCAGLIGNGDASTFSGTYTVTPKQTIKSP